MRMTKIFNFVNDEETVVRPKINIGRRAKKTKQLEGVLYEPKYLNGQIINEEWLETHKKKERRIPDMKWEKARAEFRYNQRRQAYKELETVHKVLSALPQDIITIIQTKACLPVQAMPLPKIIRTKY